MGERAALHWEEADLPRMLVMRPLEPASDGSRWVTASRPTLSHLCVLLP